MLQELLLSKVFFTKVIKTHNYFFHERNTLTDDFEGLHKKNCAFPLTGVKKDDMKQEKCRKNPPKNKNPKKMQNKNKKKLS